MADKFRINWITRGSQYGKDKPEFDEKVPGIKVWEVTSSVSKYDGGPVYCEPVDAQDANYFKQDLQIQLHEKKVKAEGKTIKGVEEFTKVKPVLNQTNQSQQTNGQILESTKDLEDLAPYVLYKYAMPKGKNQIEKE